MYLDGKRLRKARIYRNMTIDELAERIDVSIHEVSQYEKEVISPRPEVLFKLISTLAFPLEFLKKEDKVDIKLENAFLKSYTGVEDSHLAKLEVNLEIIIRIYNSLSKYFDFPEQDLPDIINIDKYSIESVVTIIRHYWGLKECPISNIVGLLENKGIIVSSLANFPQLTTFTQVFSINNVRSYFIVLDSCKDSLDKRNVDIAHELGHIILHNKLNINDLSKKELKRMENEANYFATAILLPRNAFSKDLSRPTKLDTYIKLTKKWHTSISTMLLRAKQLGLINAVEYLSLEMRTRYKLWKKDKYCDTREVQYPQILKKAIEILIENNIFTGSQIFSKIVKENYPMNPEDLELLIGLNTGTLIDEQSFKYSGLVINFKRK